MDGHAGHTHRGPADAATATSLRSERLTFPGAAGDRLAGRLERPAGPVRAYALFAHCFTCGKDVRAASMISRTLAPGGDRRAAIERDGEASVSIAGRTFQIRRAFLDDLRDGAVELAVAGLRRPLMIFHSPVDAVVEVDNARRLFEVARHPRTFVSLDDADHLLSRHADATCPTT